MILDLLEAHQLMIHVAYLLLPIRLQALELN
jgi:hypothetical protein